jgi:hypothetical protein
MELILYKPGRILEGLCNVKSHLEHPQSYEDLKEVTVFIDDIIKNTRQVSISLIFQIKD